MPKKPQILHQKIVARSRLFSVEAIGLRFTNGVERLYERLTSSSNGAVIVVPLLDDDTVLLVREYAAGTHSYELGLPKGRVEQDEDLLAAANRELMEEVGFGSGRLELLRAVTLAPAYLSHRTHVVLARDLFPRRLPGDEPEDIEVVPWPLTKLNELLYREDFSEARSMAALFMVRERLQKGDLNDP